jgi:hypothetical protein
MFRNGVYFISPNSANTGYYNYLRMVDGYVQATNSFRAPIFYDSDNTGYYMDPASTSNISALTVAVINNIHPSVDVWHESSEGKSRFYFAPNSTTYYRTGAYFVFRNNSDTGVMTVNDTGYLKVNTSGDNYASYPLHVVGTGYATGDFRAPIFYDSNDTSYYVNPNSNSVILDLYIDRKLKQSGCTGTRFFSFNVDNVCNTKAKLHFPGWFWGNIEISATSSYNYANRAGIVKRLYSFGGSPAGDQYVNESRIVESMGQTPGGITFGNIFWDSAVSKWAIIVASRDCSANGYQLEVKCFCPDSTSRDAIIDSMTLSATYTSDSTAYPYPDPYYSGRLGIAGSSIPAGYQFYVASGPSYFQNYTYCENQIYGTLLYDSNNTGYYCDPTNESNMGRVTLGGS